MKDISKEEYDYAVFIVQTFHRQMESLMDVKKVTTDRIMPEVVLMNKTSSSAVSHVKVRIEDTHVFDLEGVRTGDYVLSVRTNSIHITKGKKYEVFDEYGGAIRIKDDSGIVKALSRQNKFRLWTCVS